MADRYCTNCGAELPEDARFCATCGRPAHETAAVSTPEADVPVPPPPGQQGWETASTPQEAATEEPPRRSTANKVLLGCAGLAVLSVLFVGCVAVLAIGTGGGGGGESAGSNNAPAAENEEQQPAEKEEQAAQEDNQAAEKKEKVYGVGDKVNVGDVSYTVTSAQPKTRLTDTYGIDPPKTGNFVVVDFTFANNGTEPVTMSDVGLYLYDSKNREYETASDMFGYIPEEKDIFLIDRINPGLSKEAQVIYTVPPDASGFELEVTSGFFQSEVERIKLGF